jgi:hypothetical protein
MTGPTDLFHPSLTAYSKTFQSKEEKITPSNSKFGQILEVKYTKVAYLKNNACLKKMQSFMSSLQQNRPSQFTPHKYKIHNLAVTLNTRIITHYSKTFNKLFCGLAYYFAITI